MDKADQKKEKKKQVEVKQWCISSINQHKIFTYKLEQIMKSVNGKLCVSSYGKLQLSSWYCFLWIIEGLLIISAWLEEQDCDLPHIEVDEMFGFVSDIRAEVTANNTMPSGVIFLIELFLDVCGNILLDVELL